MKPDKRKKINFSRIGVSAAACLALTLPLTGTAIADAPAREKAAPVEAMGSPVMEAMNWFLHRKGDRSYNNLCELAVAKAWNRSIVHSSAKTHWTSSDGAKHTSGMPPKGSFVFWDNGGRHWHVGLSDGAGGVWGTNFGSGGAIDFKPNYKRIPGFKYVGWKSGNPG
ncbi:hypothetical protein LRS74_32860 [Streptomyces sp. LX-29]|uniref:hypothetical protein n=1 Tax=Streptomyces sp. LX-29 TaxID=2900152 RepID=UPI00240D721D|nr:hypothetical protein [Streptomyces sp. LX-29]WFB11296.1 hypothetical protein LRS74_32860 [Streptomyces sp. LX-29]